MNWEGGKSKKVGRWEGGKVRKGRFECGSWNEEVGKKMKVEVGKSGPSVLEERFA